MAILVARKEVVVLIMVVQVIEIVNDFSQTIIPKKRFGLPGFLLNHPGLGLIEDVPNTEGDHV